MYESKRPYHYGTGRRKASVARVRVYENGTGSITINGRDIDEYFGLETLKLLVRQPLNTTGTIGKVDIVCTVEGGALTIGGQLELTVDEVLPEATDSTVEEGKVILTTNLKSSEEYTAPLLSLQSGDRLTVSVRSGAEDADWSEVVNLIGAPELLVVSFSTRASFL